jgi:hypothetical protein
MREQTLVMPGVAISNLPRENVSKTQDALLRCAAFVLGLVCAYFEVCCGTPMPSIEMMEERKS